MAFGGTKSRLIAGADTFVSVFSRTKILQGIDEVRNRT